MVSMTTVRDEVHELIDTLLTDEEVLALREFLDRLERAEHPFERAMLRASLLEPEELSAEDLDAIREAEEEIARGELIPHEEIRRELFGEDRE
jgi:predicted transcriptional regulator